MSSSICRPLTFERSFWKKYSNVLHCGDDRYFRGVEKEINDFDLTTLGLFVFCLVVCFCLFVCCWLLCLINSCIRRLERCTRSVRFARLCTFRSPVACDSGAAPCFDEARRGQANLIQVKRAKRRDAMPRRATQLRSVITHTRLRWPHCVCLFVCLSVCRCFCNSFVLCRCHHRLSLVFRFSFCLSWKQKHTHKHRPPKHWSTTTGLRS